MRKKVLVLTTEFRGVPMGYGKAFEESDCDVRTIISPVDCPKWNIIYRIKKRIGLSNEKYLEKKDERFAKRVLAICEEYKPDIIYVCQGTQLRPATIDILKENYYIVVDLIDKLEFFPVLKEYVSHYHRVYTYSKEDSDKMNLDGIDCHYIPAIGNPYIFRPLKVERDIDICFVGATYPEQYYGDRLEIINKLIEDFPDKHIFVGGECAPLRRPQRYLKWILNKKNRQVFNNKNIDSWECNRIYNRSKICLNINRIDTGDGWSERFGNIMFSGAFQVVTYSKSIREVFGDAVETFSSYEELRDIIRYFLSNESELNARREYGNRRYSEIIKKMWEKYNIVEDILINCDRGKSR